ncbi:MAG TPA: hypothetical protein VM184_05420 [Gaiellaceae bacterium]|nr:hypothetical protein [Gaiellaceae bacterium]
MSPLTRRLKWCAVVVCAVAAVAPAGGAGAADPPELELSALTGPAGTDLYVTAPAGTTTFERVHVQVGDTEDPEEEARILNLKDVALQNGVATIDLGAEAAGTPVRVDAHIRAAEPSKTLIHRGRTTIRLRPDLTVTSVDVFRPCPTSSTGCVTRQTLTTQPVDVVATIEELNGETGAAAEVKLMLGPTPVAASANVSLAPGGDTSVRFEDVTLATATTAELTVVVDGASPAETDDSNNARPTTMEVTEHELVRTDVLVSALGGYGAQFNQHVYAPITNLPPERFADLETAVKEFEPQLVRIFYNENFEEVGQPRYDPENIVSFRTTVALAQEAGATINITYQTFGDARLAPGPHMARFAAELENLVENQGYTNVRWVTVANEPNSPGLALTLQQWEALHRALHAELVARGLREHIKIMGGDLVESSGARDHEIWFEYMTANMADIVDAYSEHIYWWYDTFNLEGARRFEFRLRDIRKLVVDDNPSETRRPAYIMEFAVRGHNAAPGQPTVTNHAYYKDGTEMRRTNVAAFQQLWFTIASAQLGFFGAAKWDLYWGKYDFTNPPNQSYWMINPTLEGWELFPSYHALRLLLSTTERGWQVVRVEPWARDDWDPLVRDEPEKEIAAYVGSTDQLTLVGLDTRGRLLNTASDETPTYSIGGLTPSTRPNLAIWNANGDGRTSAATEITTSAAGVARFEVPLHAAFALTTVDVH